MGCLDEVSGWGFWMVLSRWIVWLEYMDDVSLECLDKMSGWNFWMG